MIVHRSVITNKIIYKAMPYQATVKATGEKITVYKLDDGTWYDYDKMGQHEPPQSKTGKKKFEASELTNIKKLNS